MKDHPIMGRIASTMALGLAVEKIFAEQCICELMVARHWFDLNELARTLEPATGLWCLHIIGPDDVHAAPSKAHALRAAARFNDHFEGIANGVLCRAVAEPWPHSAESHAESVERFCSEWLAPREDGAAASCAPELESLRRFKSYVHERLDIAGIPADSPSPHRAAGCRVGGRLDIALAAVAQLASLRDLVNSPHTNDFLESVRTEVAHQIERWGTVHDRAKEPADWYWLLAYLSGKALAAHIAGDVEKAKHHTISSAAVLANWHAAITCADNRMAPGAGDLQQFLQERFGDAAPAVVAEA